MSPSKAFGYRRREVEMWTQLERTQLCLTFNIRTSNGRLVAHDYWQKRKEELYKLRTSHRLTLNSKVKYLPRLVKASQLIQLLKYLTTIWHYHTRQHLLLWQTAVHRHTHTSANASTTHYKTVTYISLWITANKHCHCSNKYKLWQWILISTCTK